MNTFNTTAVHFTVEQKTGQFYQEARLASQLNLATPTLSQPVGPVRQMLGRWFVAWGYKLSGETISVRTPSL